MDLEQSHNQKKDRITKPWVKKLILAVIGIAIIVAGFFIIRNQIIKSSGIVTERQVERIINRMGGNILLPQNERPSVLIIEDVERLRATQPFYTFAENGHYLVLFQQNGLAFIYDFDNDIIINVGPLQIPTSTQPGIDTDQVSARVEIRTNNTSRSRIEEIRNVLTASPFFEVHTIRENTDLDEEVMTVIHRGDASTYTQARQLATLFDAVLIEEASEEGNTQASIVLVIPLE